MSIYQLTKKKEGKVSYDPSSLNEAKGDKPKKENGESSFISN